MFAFARAAADKTRENCVRGTERLNVHPEQAIRLQRPRTGRRSCGMLDFVLQVRGLA